MPDFDLIPSAHLAENGKYFCKVTAKVYRNELGTIVSDPVFETAEAAYVVAHKIVQDLSPEIAEKFTKIKAILRSIQISLDPKC